MRRLGSFCLVLHTHLPWVAHHGSWPVGEEWLHQAFTGSWRRVVTMLESLAEQGYSQVATIGITPVLAAMLDDPYCLRELHSWAGRWQLRAEELAQRPGFDRLATHERAAATQCLSDLEARWLTGGLSSVLRPLIAAGTIELLGGPATHPFQPLLSERFAQAQLGTGLADTALRLGHRPAGIWAPECGYAPGLEALYAQAGVQHFLVDGPALDGRTGRGAFVGDSDVVCFARDRDLSYRIWSARDGYPAGAAYRDFHTFDHDSGFRPARVTGLEVSGPDKARWDPAAAAAAAERDALRFVRAVQQRLQELAKDPQQDGHEPLVVAAFDTELFGHWWYEGPEFLSAVLRLLPESGVELRTLAGARDAGLVSRRVHLAPSSWGAGQDWRVWDNDAVADLLETSSSVQNRLFELLDRRGERPSRDPVLDQLARQALLLSSSDWAFMITRDAAAGYARERAERHADDFFGLADLSERADDRAAVAEAARQRQRDGLFGRLDARTF
ncbi:DUF1957 domain-containing protein [Jatrophihabitans telluris]|uniref:DUF1957 domain-containing protein n=1 Tax=Jatrophihabitans telluris TaxID=2038343 RepID=A0ABY4R296_9ACTN|nr:1,4-alpha-glucan branching protein domain-containing protein [Jatrophihabitans telluris]UQX89918.1 DUF1957 domain-containing protein [Jatrophihabitans telluris]